MSDQVTENSNQCFVCGKGLGHIEHFPPYQCHGATVFQSSGNYGSGLFDTLLGGEYLVINVCDTCLGGRRNLVLKRTVVQADPENVYEPWEPERDCE